MVFPGLSGTVAMGETIEEAMQNAELALAESVEEAIERGWPIPPPRPFSEVEIPPEFDLVGILLIEAPARDGQP